MSHHSTKQYETLDELNAKADKAERHIQHLARELAACEPGTFDYVHLESKQRLALVQYNRLIHRIHKMERE